MSIRLKYTDDQITFLKDNCKGKTVYDLLDLFNDRFGTDLVYNQIRNCLKNHKITTDVDRKSLSKYLKRIFTEEQEKFIRDHVKGRQVNELTELINDQFGSEYTYDQVRAYLKNHKITCGVKCQFKKGDTPSNKGKKGVGGWEPTQFKKGQKPHNYMPVGSERINTEGYIDVKIADPKKWRAKHHIIWEQLHGPIPKGHVVIFGDGNKLNLDPNNLILITNKQLLMMNRNNLIQKDADLTRTAVIIADLYQKIYDRKS